jgi:hypothetical protein
LRRKKLEKTDPMQVTISCFLGLGAAVLGLISSTFLILSVKTRQEATANQASAVYEMLIK